MRLPIALLLLLSCSYMEYAAEPEWFVDGESGMKDEIIGVRGRWTSPNDLQAPRGRALVTAGPALS